MEQSFDDILSVLVSIRDATTYKVRIPNTSIDLDFKQLSTEQYNKILREQVMDSNEYDKNFFRTMDNIFRENITTNDVQINELTVLERLYIILKTKQHCLSDNLEIFYTEEEIEKYNLTENSYSITLTDFLKEKNNILALPPLTVKVENIEVVCAMPTIQTDNLFEEYIGTLVNQNVSLLIEEYFTKEIAKHIKELTIDGNAVNLSVLRVEQILQLIRNLPAKLINEVIVNIEKIKKPIQDLLSVNIPYGSLEGSLVKTFIKEIQVDENIFN